MEEQNIFYHVTPRRNVKAIKRMGILPMIGPRSTKIGETMPAVYLFASYSDVVDAFHNWLGEQFNEAEELALLKIHLPKKEIDGLVRDEFEYKALNAIKPRYIVGWYDEQNEPLFPAECRAFRLLYWRVKGAFSNGVYRLRSFRFCAPSRAVLAYRADTARWHFFANTGIGKAISNWAASLHDRHPENKMLGRIFVFCLPF